MSTQHQVHIPHNEFFRNRFMENMSEASSHTYAKRGKIKSHRKNKRTKHKSVKASRNTNTDVNITETHPDLCGAVFFLFFFMMHYPATQ